MTINNNKRALSVSLAELWLGTYSQELASKIPTLPEERKELARKAIECIDTLIEDLKEVERYLHSK